MPIININILKGRSDEQKEALIHELTEACQRALGSSKESVHVIISEMDKQHYGAGGVSYKKKTDG
uniref:2-hydroxymuconate tautomerase n=1 Tax=Halomonas sp. TaxID=1486246 RepID=UPI0026363717|nr:2-hydroxymuconate tautomerase [Halomonas sp.]